MWAVEWVLFFFEMENIGMYVSLMIVIIATYMYIL